MSKLFFIGLIFLLVSGRDGYMQETPDSNLMYSESQLSNRFYSYIFGAIVRGDTTKKELSIVFTGDAYADGATHIIKVLRDYKVKASFFFTGNYYRELRNEPYIRQLINDGHYLGAHSNKHLLYCDWENRGHLLISKKEFLQDLEANYEIMEQFGIHANEASLFLPPYEWYNKEISNWTRDAGLQLINYTQGTLSNADYTTPSMKNYRSNEEIWKSIVDFEKSSGSGLNGFILLIHIGTAPERKNKFYYKLEDLILWFTGEGYSLRRIDDLIDFDSEKN